MYLSRRRDAGMPVIHRMAGGAGSVDDPGGRRDEPSEERGEDTIRIKSRPAGTVEHAEFRGMGGQSGDHTIRYREESRHRQQGTLFGSDETVEAPDLGGYDLGSLEAFVSTCTRCPLHGDRTQTVFGSGSPNAGIVFIGEAPGREEDLQGLPFVGRAGKLLTKILASVGLSREEVYITNILKCRPPGNRDPHEDEVTACESYLRRQIELLNPALICALGRVAGQNLLKRNASLSVLRQGVHYYNDTKVIVMYHPAALLRNPNLKKSAWEDIQLVRKLYDEALGEA